MSYKEKFTDNVAPLCERTAPSSFKYEATVEMVLPTQRMKYFGTTLSVPADVSTSV